MPALSDELTTDVIAGSNSSKRQLRQHLWFHHYEIVGFTIDFGLLIGQRYATLLIS